MENPTVVTGLVGGDDCLLVHHEQADLRMPGQNLTSGRQPQDAGTDDHDVVEIMGLAGPGDGRCQRTAACRPNGVRARSESTAGYPTGKRTGVQPLGELIRPGRDTIYGLVQGGSLRRSSTAQENCIPPHVFPVGNPRRFTPLAWRHQLGPGGHKGAERRTDPCREWA